MQADKLVSFKPKLLEAERSTEFCGRRSCSNPGLGEATPTESQSKNVLPVLSDGGAGLTSISTEPSWSMSSRDLPTPKDVHFLAKLQRERRAKLASLIDPNHELMCQFGYSTEATVEYLLKVLSPAKPKAEEKSYGCQMPLTRSANCEDCKQRRSLSF